VSIVQLLVQQVSKLVQARREMPESQEAVVRRPVKWAQSGRLLPLLWSDSSLRWDDHIKRDPDGPDCLKAVHGGRLYDTHLVSSYDFREAARSFVVFVDTKVNAWGFLINEPDCLKNSVSLSSLHPRGLSSGAGYCHFLWVLWCTSLRQKPNLLGTMLRALQHQKQYICSSWKAATLATPETKCLLYESYWFRPILSELIGAATETATINRNRAPEKVSVNTQHNDTLPGMNCLHTSTKGPAYPAALGPSC